MTRTAPERSEGRDQVFEIRPSWLLEEADSLGTRHRRRDMDRVSRLEAALRACMESLRLIEVEYLEGEGFASWSHPAISLRMAEAALAGEEIDALDDPANRPILHALDASWQAPPERVTRVREKFLKRLGEEFPGHPWTRSTDK